MNEINFYGTLRSMKYSVTSMRREKRMFCRTDNELSSQVAIIDFA